MKNSIKNGVQSQGDFDPEMLLDDAKELKDIETWLTKDLQILRSLVTAIAGDPDLIRHLAVFMHGRLINEKNRKADAKQGS